MVGLLSLLVLASVTTTVLLLTSGARPWPPPAAHRLICSVTTAVKEVRSKVTVVRYYTRRASIAIDPSTGALKLNIAAPRRGREMVTP